MKKTSITIAIILFSVIFLSGIRDVLADMLSKSFLPLVINQYPPLPSPTPTLPAPTPTPTPIGTPLPHTPQITFQHQLGGRIYLTEALTGNSTEFLVPPPGYKYWGAKWSTDGTKIAFSNDYGEIFTANWDGSNIQKIVKGDLSSRSQPAWSPFGDTIIYRGWDSPNAQSDLWAITISGNNPINLTNSLGIAEQDPIWSPKGDLVAYLCFTPPLSSYSDICVMNADGSNQRPLINTPNANERHPSWSPDGNKLVFYSTTDGDSEIFIINTDGRDLIKLTDNFELDSNPSWSPDGNYIAFTSSRAGGLDIFIMDIDGSNPVDITNTATWDESAAYWSPDSSMIAIEGKMGSTMDVFAMNRDGTNAKRMNLGFSVELPDWRP